MMHQECADDQGPAFSNIRFTKSTEPFYRLMCERVNAYFKRKEQTVFASRKMIGKGIFLGTLFLGTYALLISNYFQGWSLFLIQILFYLSIFLVSVGVAHDGSHNAYSRYKWVNKSLTMVFDLIGINSFMWEFNHIKSHHRLPNVPKYDSAIDSFKFFRFHPKADLYPVHKYQHLYIPLIYGCSTLFKIFFLDFYSFGRKKIGLVQIEQHSLKDLAWFVISKAFVILYMLILPLTILDAPAWQILTGFLCGHFIAGLVLGIVFMVTHISDHAVWPEPDDNGLIHNSFPRHILETTTDFCPQNRWVTWIAGGLNNHVAHHLFPGISQIHLPEVTKIVQKTAIEFNVPYKCYLTVLSAIKSHLRTLKKLGQPGSNSSFSVISGMSTSY